MGARCIDTPICEVQYQLVQGLELNGVDPFAAGAFYVGQHVVGEEALAREAAGLGDGFTIDERVGLHRLDFEGKHLGVEMIEQRIIAGQHPVVNGVGIRQQDQPVTLAKFAEQRFGNDGAGQEDRGPKVAELRIGESDTDDIEQLFNERFGLDLASFETSNEIGGGDALRNLGRGVAAERRKAGVGALEIEGHNDAAEVEDEGFGFGHFALMGA